MGFQSVVLQLDPVLFQVKGQTEQEQFQRDIGFSPHEEALKLAVAFEYAKGALHLDRAIYSEKSSSFRDEILVSLLSALCKLLADFNFFAEVQIFGFGTLLP